ncbi:MAG: DUF86 domain-containing protein [archaeon]
MHSNRKIRKQEIEHKLVEMDDYIEQIEQNLPSTEEEFAIKGIEKHGIYKLTESAIESIIKICSMINSDLKLGIPSDEDDIIKNLVKNKIISKKIAEKIREMKGFRNILVHRYGKVNDEEAFENIKENLGDFDEFKEEVMKFLDGQR